MPPKKAKEVEKFNIGSLYDLDHVDQALLRHLIKYPDARYIELIEISKLTENAIRARRNKPEFRRAWSEITATTAEHLKEAARRAAVRLKKLVDDDDKQVALKAVGMALGPYINKSQVDINMAPRLIFKTTVQADGGLLQEVIAEELGAAIGAAAEAARERLEESEGDSGAQGSEGTGDA